MGGNKLCLLTYIFLVFFPPLLAGAEQAKKPLSGLNIQEFEKTSSTKTNWNNNPFVIPANDVSVTDLKLTGIVYSGSDSAAVVNDQAVKVGDKVGSNEIVSIEKSRVVVRNENGLFSLMLAGGVK